MRESTAYKDILEEFGEQFAGKLWTLIYYDESSDYWKSQIGTKLDYIGANQLSDNFSDGVTFGVDIAVVCALPDVELSAVLRLPCGWQPLDFRQDETRYYTGILPGKSKRLHVIAAAAPRMGIAASAVLTTKMISLYRPRYVVMIGIAVEG